MKKLKKITIFAFLAVTIALGITLIFFVNNNENKKLFSKKRISIEREDISPEERKRREDAAAKRWAEYEKKFPKTEEEKALDKKGKILAEEYKALEKQNKTFEDIGKTLTDEDARVLFEALRDEDYPIIDVDDLAEIPERNPVHDIMGWETWGEEENEDDIIWIESSFN
jgi:hypothetical protein